MIISIHGPTCSGKTTAAQELALRLGRQLRSCGDVVRARAAALGVPIAVVPDAVHRKIDAETVHWIERNPNGIVEGRFLDRVLDGIPEILFIGLSADSAVRASRGRLRRSDYTLADLLRSDDEDDVFRCRMYGSSPTNHALTVDTTYLTVEECTRKIERLLQVAPSARG